MSVSPSILPTNEPETPHSAVVMLPVTSEPDCWKVAVALEPAHPVSNAR